MSQEILNSAIMQMRAKALEAYGIIKDIYRQPSQEGDADRIANLSLKLAQYEGGMLTLQQYAPEIISTVAAEIAAEKAAEEEQAAGLEDEEAGAELPDPEELEQNAADNAPEEIAEEELTKRSATYRRSSAGRKRASRSKKKKAEDES
jgi:hypothetical protein